MAKSMGGSVPPRMTGRRMARCCRNAVSLSTSQHYFRIFWLHRSRAAAQRARGAQIARMDSIRGASWASFPIWVGFGHLCSCCFAVKLPAEWKRDWSPIHRAAHAWTDPCVKWCGVSSGWRRWQHLRRWRYASTLNSANGDRCFCVKLVDSADASAQLQSDRVGYHRRRGGLPIRRRLPNRRTTIFDSDLRSGRTGK